MITESMFEFNNNHYKLREYEGNYNIFYRNSNLDWGPVENF